MIHLRTIFFNCLVGLLVASCVIQDEAGPREEDAYVKYFGSSGEQRMVDMVITTDEHIVMLGAQRVAADGSTFDIVLYETDTFGNQVRQAKAIDVGSLLGDSVFTAESPSNITRIENGYLVVSSFAQLIEGSATESNIFWAELDNSLEIVQWDTISAGPSNNIWGNDIIMTQDGNVVIVGATDRPEINDLTNNPQVQYWIGKIYMPDIDSTMFRKSFGYPGTNDESIAVFEYDDGNLAVVSSTEQIGNEGALGNNVGFTILNPLATSLVADEIYGVAINEIPISADDVPNDVIQVSAGFLIVGTSSYGETQDAFVMGILNSGQLLSSRALASKWVDDNLNLVGNDVTVSRTGDLVITGAYTMFDVSDPDYKGLATSKNSEILFMRTSQTGSERRDYEYNYGLVGGNDVGEAIVTLSNGSILIGATADFGSNQTMMALMKMNDRGILQRQD